MHESRSTTRAPDPSTSLGMTPAAAERALRSAGSRPARRDPIDARIIQSIIRGDGRIIDSQNEVGGYPVRAATARAVVVPKDRRAWLEALSKELAVDRALNVAPLWERLKCHPERSEDPLNRGIPRR